jgi:hypothetical protein
MLGIYLSTMDKSKAYYGVIHILTREASNPKKWLSSFFLAEQLSNNRS